MAKKRANKVPATKQQKTAKPVRLPVRLDLSESDYERLERCALERGLTRSSYARQAVLERIKADERNSQ